MGNNVRLLAASTSLVAPRRAQVLLRCASTVADTSPAARPDQTLTLSDGRRLGFVEYGSPSGKPLLFFHGYPSSRLEAAQIDPLAARHGLRLISADRPGFGLSDFKPDRRIVDWPADVRELTTHLGLSRFAVLGGSGGGPYALACAHKLPREMLSAVGMLASAGPWEAGIKDVSWVTYMNYLGATYWPRGLEGLTNGSVRGLKRISATGPVTRWLDGWLDSISGDAADKLDASAKEERRKNVLKLMFEAFTQGAAAFVQEAQLLSLRDWGFRFEEVKYNRVQIWHGKGDVNAPIRMIRYMAERLPFCELKEYDEAHFTIANHLDSILGELIAATDENREKDQNPKNGELGGGGGGGGNVA